MLKEENCELKKKIERFKVSNEETKKMLRDRICTFNEAGGELQGLRMHIQTLEDRVHCLLN